MPVKIVTDSACDLDDSVVAELGISVVPLSIRFGSEEFVDRVTLSPQQFYDRMASSPTLPETSAPAPGAFEKVFREALDDGADGIVCINLSGDLSATIQSAQNAARALDGAPIRIIDSRTVTGGLGSQVVAAARAARAGATVEQVVTLVDDLVLRTRVFGALDTLDNLKKGGRIGGAQALIGGLLSVKPIIEVRDGVVHEAGKPRTRGKALRALVDKLKSAGPVENVYVLHGLAPDADELVSLVAEVIPRDQLTLGIIGATIGTHGGPRLAGITFQVK
ncbi:MAG: fatty acid kinase fatty acid binding subunit [Actinomycetota bacterium]|nr:fatty acid kinase fatty acid binding subunit [Actinomycetota bacterium]